MGHSFGEYAAACVAGVFSLADATRIVVARGRLAAGLPPGGTMAVVEASEDEIRTAIAQQGTDVAIAAFNGPTNTVVSGAKKALIAGKQPASTPSRPTRPISTTWQAKS